MKEFLEQNYSLITHSVEIMAAVIGLIFYKKYKYTAVKFFIWFLVYVAVCDFFGSYAEYVKEDSFLSFLKGTIIETNHWWITSTWFIGSILFFSYFYQKTLKTKLYKHILKYGAFVFLIISIIQIVTDLESFFNHFFPLISILGAVIILLCTIFYFIEVLRSENILMFYRYINFYISLAIFIWWLIITPLVFYDIYNSQADWTFVILKWQIYLFANIFMYTTFTIGLIVSKPEPLSK